MAQGQVGNGRDGERPERAATRAYVAVISVAGFCLLAYLLATHFPADHLRSATFWLFTAFVVASELLPIPVRRGHDVGEITTSTTFAFALMLAFDAATAAVALAAASIVGDTARRKPLYRSGFNAAQYTLAIGAAGAMYHGLAAGPPSGAEDLPAVLVGALAFFVVNTSVTSAAVALSLGVPVPRYVAKEFVFEAYTAPALLSLSPIVVLVADVSLWFVPLLAIPVAAVYWGATVALENVRLVERLRGSLDYMTELNRAKDDFVAVVSHELRTPLTSIQGYIKTMLQLTSELDEEQRRAFLEAADRQSDRLRRLIEQLLVVARLESHVEPLSVSQVTIPALTANVIDELRPRAHGHTFDARFASDLPMIETDESKLYQVLSNLVENALKYSPPDTRVSIEGQPSLSGIVLSVSDEGPGIPPESQDRVFERFFQVDQSSTRAAGGTGLGLYICKKMSEMIGARLWLDRSDHTGSTFSLFLPLSPPGEEEGDDLAPAATQSITARV